MEDGQLTSCAQWATIVGVVLTMVAVIIAFFVLKRQSKRIRNCEAKITNIATTVNQHNEYQAGLNQYIGNITVCEFVISPEQIEKTFNLLSKESEHE